MGIYTAEQLSGAGTPMEALTAGVSYVFNIFVDSPNFTPTAYFTVEQQGISFTSSDATNAIGTYSSFDWDTANLITSSYKSSVVVDRDTQNVNGTYQFTPDANIAASSSFLRGTGGVYCWITV